MDTGSASTQQTEAFSFPHCPCQGPGPGSHWHRPGYEPSSDPGRGPLLGTARRGTGCLTPAARGVGKAQLPEGDRRGPSQSQAWPPGGRKQQVSTQARYSPRRPGDQLWTYILTPLRAPVPGSCGGNGWDTFCPLLASEHRHRWQPRWLGPCEPGTGSWHGPGAAAQRCHAGPGCSCPDALGRGFPLTALDLQALGKSAKRAGFLGGGAARGL